MTPPNQPSDPSSWIASLEERIMALENPDNFAQKVLLVMRKIFGSSVVPWTRLPKEIKMEIHEDLTKGEDSHPEDYMRPPRPPNP